MYYFSMFFGLMICQIFSQGSNSNRVKLFVKLSSWTKRVHPLTPGSIRSLFQMQAQEFYNFFLGKPVLCIYIFKWYMIRKCHLHNFAKFSLTIFYFHIFVCSLFVPWKRWFNVKQRIIKRLTQQSLFDQKTQMSLN